MEGVGCRRALAVEGSGDTSCSRALAVEGSRGAGCSRALAVRGRWLSEGAGCSRALAVGGRWLSKIARYRKRRSARTARKRSGLAGSGELNLVLSENPSSQSRRTTTACCSITMADLEKLFGSFVDSSCPTTTFKFRTIRLKKYKWT